MVKQPHQAPLARNKKLKNQDTLMNFATSKGLLSADLYGATFSETHMFLFDSLILGDAKAENQKMKLKLS